MNRNEFKKELLVDLKDAFADQSLPDMLNTIYELELIEDES